MQFKFILQKDKLIFYKLKMRIMTYLKYGIVFTNGVVSEKFIEKVLE